MLVTKVAARGPSLCVQGEACPVSLQWVGLRHRNTPSPRPMPGPLLPFSSAPFHLPLVWWYLHQTGFMGSISWVAPPVSHQRGRQGLGDLTVGPVPCHVTALSVSAVTYLQKSGFSYRGEENPCAGTWLSPQPNQARRLCRPVVAVMTADPRSPLLFRLVQKGARGTDSTCFPSAAPSVALTHGRPSLLVQQGARWAHLAQVGQPPLDKPLTTPERSASEGAAQCSHRACAGASGGFGHRSPVITLLCRGR